VVEVGEKQFLFYSPLLLMDLISHPEYSQMVTGILHDMRISQGFWCNRLRSIQIWLEFSQQVTLNAGFTSFHLTHIHEAVQQCIQKPWWKVDVVDAQTQI
jgi:hypothetical protein